MQTSDPLIGALAGGHFVSGEAIASRLGISRAAVWKRVRALRARGLPIDAVRGRGYRLYGGSPLLSAQAVAGGLHLPVRTRLKRLDVEWEVDSTNTRLLARDAPAPSACIAEIQTAGRGRRGRVWHAPFGGAVTLSVAWVFDQLPRGFGAAGLVAGVAACDALASFGYREVQLKWPNDLMVGGAKVGGLLVESRGEAGGSTRVVVGIGINWRVPAAALQDVDQRWTDLASVPVALPTRDALAAALINAFIAALDEFSMQGFAPFRTRWSARDALAGREVAVRSDDSVVEGRAVGVDDDGALCVESAGRRLRFTAGEVSVRAAP